MPKILEAKLNAEGKKFSIGGQPVQRFYYRQAGFRSR